MYEGNKEKKKKKKYNSNLPFSDLEKPRFLEEVFPSQALLVVQTV